MAESLNGSRRRRTRLAKPSSAARKARAPRHIVRAALVEVAPKFRDRLGRESRSRGEARVVAPVTRQKRELNPAPPCQRRQFIEPVTPILGAAEDAGDDEFRLCAHRLKIEIDRVGMAERGETRRVLTSASAQARSRRQKQVRSGRCRRTRETLRPPASDRGRPPRPFRRASGPRCGERASRISPRAPPQPPRGRCPSGQ